MAGLDIAVPPPSDPEVWAPSSLPGPWAQGASTCVRVELELSLGAGGWVVVVVVVVFKFEDNLSRLVEGWNPGEDEIRGQVVCWAQIC